MTSVRCGKPPGSEQSRTLKPLLGQAPAAKGTQGDTTSEHFTSAEGRTGKWTVFPQSSQRTFLTSLLPPILISDADMRGRERIGLQLQVCLFSHQRPPNFRSTASLLTSLSVPTGGDSPRFPASTRASGASHLLGVPMSTEAPEGIHTQGVSAAALQGWAVTSRPACTRTSQLPPPSSHCA